MVSYHVSITEYFIIRSWWSHWWKFWCDFSIIKVITYQANINNIQKVYIVMISCQYGLMMVSVNDFFCLFFLKCGGFAESQVWALKLVKSLILTTTFFTFPWFFGTMFLFNTAFKVPVIRKLLATYFTIMFFWSFSFNKMIF